jgi:hypothetical protein
MYWIWIVPYTIGFVIVHNLIDMQDIGDILPKVFLKHYQILGYHFLPIV